MLKTSCEKEKTITEQVQKNVKINKMFENMICSQIPYNDKK